MRDLGSPVHSKNLFINIINCFKGTVKIGIVYYKDKPVASGLVTIFENYIEIPWASSLKKYNRFSPNMLLYWSLLEYSCNKGFKKFDFGRSTPGEGTYKFKLQWGGVPENLNWYYFNFQNIDENEFLQNNSGKKNQKLISIWQKLPLPLANLIGHKVRGSISL